MRTIFYALLLLTLFSACEQKQENTDNLEDLTEKATETGMKKVIFTSKDGLEITADYYSNGAAEKIVLLFHQAEYSRGEYKDIAPQLVEAGYACLAVDLRSGNIANEVINETAAKAKKQKRSQKFMDALQDVEAAIEYAAQNSNKKIVLWGSSYSAGLVIMAGVDDDRVTRIVSISPGEYFSRQGMLRDKAKQLQKPIFVTGGKAELDVVVKPIAQAIDKNFLVLYEPEANTDHGSKALWPFRPGAEEGMKAILQFL